jgi:DNA-binding NtrC family response regulator
VPTAKTRVLVLAREPVIAALLAMLMELDGYTVDFAQPGERPEDAIARLRPPMIVCADGGLPEIGSDLFLARAAKRARVVLFSGPEIAAEVRALAERRGFPFFDLPVDLETLARVLDEAMAT